MRETVVLGPKGVSRDGVVGGAFVSTTRCTDRLLFVLACSFCVEGKMEQHELLDCAVEYLLRSVLYHTKQNSALRNNITYPLLAEFTQKKGQSSDQCD